MNTEKIREIIYSKCKVYRKEEQNPYKEDSVEIYSWRIEKTMMQFNVPNLENNVKNYHSLTDIELADRVIQHIHKRYFEFHTKAGELYDKLKPLPFPSE